MKQSYQQVLIIGMLILKESLLFANSSEKAFKLHQRLTGVPPSEQILKQMADLIEEGKSKEAAAVAIKNPQFLNSTVFDLFAPMTNEDAINRVPLDDFIATAIGFVKDEIPFNQILNSDIIYTAPDGTTAAWNAGNNNMYFEHQTKNPIDFSSTLVKKQQSIVMKTALKLPDSFTDYAGLLTTRSFAVAYYFDGTNRAALNYGLDAFICRDIESLSDNSRSDQYVRQDVERNPGNDSTVYITKCLGCHAGMDSLGGAFAHFHSTAVNGQLIYSITPDQVQKKYSINSANFPAGYITKDNSWINLWNEGRNVDVGWKGPQTGKGVKELGTLITATSAFPLCMAKRVYAKVCLKSAKSVENATINDLANSFSSNNFNMKNLFIESAIKCMEN